MHWIYLCPVTPDFPLMLFVHVVETPMFNRDNHSLLLKAKKQNEDDQSEAAEHVPRLCLQSLSSREAESAPVIKV